MLRALSGTKCKARAFLRPGRHSRRQSSTGPPTPAPQGTQGSGPSLGSLVVVAAVLNVAALEFLAIQSVQDDKMDKTVREIPLLGNAVNLFKQINDSTGITAAIKPAAREQRIEVELPEAKLTHAPEEVDPAKEKGDMMARIEEMRQANKASLQQEDTQGSNDNEESEFVEQQQEQEVGTRQAEDGLYEVAEDGQDPVEYSDMPEEVRDALVVIDDGEDSEGHGVVYEEEEAVQEEQQVVVAREEQAEAAQEEAQETNGYVKVSPILPALDYYALPPVPSEEQKLRLINTEAVRQTMDDYKKEITSMRQELDASILSDLNSLDEHALRLRITQLTAEFFERAKWEGVRLHQGLRQVEIDLSRRYDEKMMQQRAELELEANKMLMSREKDVMANAMIRAKEEALQLEEAFAKALKEQAEGFQSTLLSELDKKEVDMRKQLEGEYAAEVATMRAGHNKQLMDHAKKMAHIESQVAAFNAASDKIHGINKESAHSHQFSAATLSLEQALCKTGIPCKDQLDLVKKYCNDDMLVMLLAESIPDTLVYRGAPSLLELKIRFAVVKEEVRRVALAPDGVPDFIGQMIGAALSKVYWAPPGPVQGEGAEEILSRVTHHLEQGQLKEATSELDGIKGYGQTLLMDWRSSANNRLIADHVASALRSTAIVKHAIMSTKED